MKLKHNTQTVIATTDTKTGKVQLWKVGFKDYNLITTEKLIGHGEHADIPSLNQEVKRIRNTTLSSMYFEPLQTTEEDFMPDTPLDTRLACRGYENDTEPLTVRGKAIPEIEITIWIDRNIEPPESHIQISTWGRFTPALTPTQSKELKDRFGAELMKALKPSLLKSLQNQYIKRLVAYAKRNVGQLMKQLKEIKAYKPVPDYTRDQIVEKAHEVYLDKGQNGASDFLRQIGEASYAKECLECRKQFEKKSNTELKFCYTPHIPVGGDEYTCAYCKTTSTGR